MLEQGGFAGALARLDEHWLGRCAQNLPYLRKVVPLVDYFARTEDYLAVGYPPGKCTHMLLQKLGVEVDYVNIPPEITVPGQAVIAIVTSHESSIDAFAIPGAFEKRHDVSAIGVHTMTLVGDHWGKGTHPLIISVLSQSYAADRPLRLKDLFDPSHHMYRAWGYPAAKIQELNESAFLEAANRLAGGEVVAIIPMGGHGMREPWRAGLGKIIINALQNRSVNTAKTLIVPFYMNNSPSKNQFFDAAYRASHNERQNLKMQVVAGSASSLHQLCEELRDVHFTEDSFLSLSGYLQQRCLAEYEQLVKEGVFSVPQ